MKSSIKTLLSYFSFSPKRKSISEIKNILEEINYNQQKISATLNKLVELKTEEQIYLNRKNPSQRLHVIGLARSGTTILMRILNSSSDIFIFSELNLHVLRKYPEIFAHYGGTNYLEHFINRKKKELLIIDKGATPPYEKSFYSKPDEYIDKIGQKYRYCGDKIATAFREMNGIQDIVLLKEFIEEENQSNAIIFFTIRRPSENLVSIAKMFPDSNIKEWANVLIQYLILSIEAFIKGNRFYLIFHEDIGPTLLDEMSNFLKIDIPLSSYTVGSNYQSSKDTKLDLNEDWMDELDDLYNNFYQAFKFDRNLIKVSKSGIFLNAANIFISKLRLTDIKTQ